MITHFIKRDFQSNLLFWIILIIFSVSIVPFLLKDDATAMISIGLFAYVVFGTLPLHNLTGVTLRSQHIMSRYYLLALPVSRHKLFWITQLRSLVFWVPFFLFFFWAPYFPAYADSAVESMMKELQPFSAVALVLGVIWFINATISLQLGGERVTTYMSQLTRTLEWIRIAGVFILEGFVIILAFAAVSHTSKYTWVPVLVLALICGYRYVRTARNWTRVA